MAETKDSLTKITKEDVAKYWQDGYLFPINVLTDVEAGSYRNQLELIEKEWLESELPLPLNQYKRVNAHCVMPLAAKLANHPKILEAVAQIIGPDILIWSAEFFIKEPQTNHMVSMHQDLTYWGMGATSGQVTAWLGSDAGGGQIVS